MPRQHALAVARAASAGHASPEHKRFRKLQDQIEQARARLQAWQQEAALFAQQHAQRIEPLQRKQAQALRDWAFEMEQLLLGRKWSRSEQATLARAIAELAAMMLDSGEGDQSDEDDDALKALHDRHAETSFDEEEQNQLDSMKAMFETLGGVDLGDTPVGSVDELMQRAHAQMAQQREQAQADRPRENSRSGRAKAKSAAERRAEEDAARVSQTVREVYRKLASALHPDRAAPGASAEQQAERTAQMAQANAAYAAGDLLALLNLQLAIEQVDAAHVASIAATQVRHFNKVLAEQLAELQAEIEERELAFCAAYGVMEPGRLDPRQLGRVFKEALRDTLAAEQRLQAEQRALRGEPARAKAWVKRMREEQRFEDSFDDMPF